MGRTNKDKRKQYVELSRAGRDRTVRPRSATIEDGIHKANRRSNARVAVDRFVEEELETSEELFYENNGTSADEDYLVYDVWEEDS